ncbi:hypothetical protein GSA93_004585 [Salmonella enterica]|uniref:Integrase catalytic domain-containing protein n=1 Tax=Salmonella enterica subsp. enterica serovar Javiana TaxID=363569 RepID=A0A607KL34_SALET|nr:hypothetical protein [Salmonella enterica]EAR0120211.1 hypothetical protein [Salmonella enterica subsp. enterica serovar Javiana]EBF4799753.1 hypothetical protein [Salmonella enterica subsp. enterica]EDY0542906.1 hypothetical protein [Salmonella enterica subsp. enterica serovar Panama]EAO8414458.1 hypothetical protein [Salmonella enterica]
MFTCLLLRRLNTTEPYNERRPHSTPGYRSPREYLRQLTRHGLSDKKRSEIQSCLLKIYYSF